MKTILKKNEVLIKDGSANLQKNIETVGGKLYLTNERVIFEPHAFNVQSANVEIEIVDIHSSLPCWTKFLGFFPIFPNSLAIFTRKGIEYRFALFGRHAWAAAIDEVSNKSNNRR